MTKTSKIHFEISERKVLLRIIDLVAVLFVLYAMAYATDFDYFLITYERLDWVIVLVLYLSIFATVFELYDLKKSQ